eukprot:gb/GECG01015518.1/.p1 GENE.gb/GECG01015518.1/~~gb/GECG01015518.1/.p1  ORF type:complete len:287 (+),score=72.53 gb/GECG01015518.1/:1-861(+)
MASENGGDSGSVSKTIYDAFGTTDLYEILQISSKATDNDIRRAYWKQALKVHPDKNKSENATKKFQALGMVHSILSDEKKRKAYDDHGSIDEADISEEFEQWYEYFRNLFPKVTTSKIEKFQKEYVGSDEERQDIIKAFVTFKGDMSEVLDNIMFAEDDDEDRFVEIIEQAMKTGEIKTYLSKDSGIPKIKRLTAAQKKKRKQQAKREATEARKAQQEEESMGSLESMILKRQAQRGSFLNDLEAKYATSTKSNSGNKKQKKGTKKAASKEPTEEDLEKARGRLKK